MGRDSFDVVHVFQAQVAALADIYHVQYLSKPAQSGRQLSPRSRAAGSGRGAQARARGRLGGCASAGAWARARACSSAATCSSRSSSTGTRPHAVTWILAEPEPRARRHRRRRERADARRPGPDGDRTGVGVPRVAGMSARASVTCSRRAAGARRAPPVRRPEGGRVSPAGHRWSGDRSRSPRGLRPFFSAIDVLAVPSRFEPYGLVVGEAAAFGVPVVASSAVGASRLVEEFGAGEVADTTGHLADALARWSRRTPRSGEAAWRLAASTSESALAARLLALYRSFPPSSEDVTRPTWPPVRKASRATRCRQALPRTSARVWAGCSW